MSLQENLPIKGIFGPPNTWAPNESFPKMLINTVIGYLQYFYSSVGQFHLFSSSRGT